jgi:hypothetical protein
VPRRLLGLALLLVMALAAIAVALAVTPLQTIAVAGQDIRVGTTRPDLTLSGPGEIDLFGQSLPTTLEFSGPVRPKLQLSQITINSELTTFVQGAKPSGVERQLGNQLAAGWLHYFIWETSIAGAAALIAAGAVAGWRRLPRGTTVKLLVAGLAVTEAINLGAIMVTAYSAPGTLRQVGSLNQLVGNEPTIPRITAGGRALPQVQAVVIGDSTAAGDGLTPSSRATRVDRSCGRSPNAYASDLAAANGWTVLNLACNSATISHGLLGRQRHHGHRLPSQLAEARRARHASVVIVSVGADDLNWSTMLLYCAVAPRCDDKATTAYFQQQLHAFSKDYLQLLSQLATLRGHPRIVINRYYNPFGAVPGCLAGAGMTADKLRILNSRLATLNDVLAKGARQFGFSSPLPDFAGHQLCTAQPYVQGLRDPAPFHPTALGQLAIALTDQAVLQSSSGGATPGAGGATSGAGGATPGAVKAQGTGG